MYVVAQVWQGLNNYIISTPLQGINLLLTTFPNAIQTVNIKLLAHILESELSLVLD